MFIFHRPGHLRKWLENSGRTGRKVGFVPTMGALHEGHMSLVRQSQASSGLTIVSIFVNPLQFNDQRDLEMYPRPVGADIRMLAEAGADVLFHPTVDDMYPPGDQAGIDFDPGPLAAHMEGFFRPGHFRGMAEVVHRLLDIVRPDYLYMGQKDYQQLAIVRRMVHHYRLPVEVVMCPTLREANGLAMSSRNVRLSAGTRERAGLISRVLAQGAETYRSGGDPARIAEEAVARLTGGGFEVDYFEIVDGETLQPVAGGADVPWVVACCAVRAEGVRLLDNMIWKQPAGSKG